MTDKHKQLFYQIIQPIKNHIGVAMIALVYGMTAYGLIYVLLRLVRYVETL